MNTSDQRQDELAQLLQLCARQQHSALKRIYQLTSAHLFATTLRILKDEGHAEDCLQQAYVKIWQHADRYDPSKAKAMTWLSTIARNQALDLLRRQRHAHLHDSADALNNVEDPQASLEWYTARYQTAEQVHRCLEELPKEHRQCLELAYFDGYSHQNLADQLMLPLGTVKTWIRRGLARLKACLNA